MKYKLFFAFVFLILIFSLVGARDFIIYNSSNEAQPYFWVNGTTGITYGTFAGNWNGSTNYIPYTGSNTNAALGDYNFSVGTSDFFVNAGNGNVGVGNGNPNFPITVASDSGPSSWVARFGNSAGTIGVLLGVHNNVAVVGTDGATNLGINPDGGNVGIGTTNPLSLLQISKASNPYVNVPILNVIPETNWGIKLQQYHNGGGYDYYLMQNNGVATDVNLLTFKQGGNVGIGTTTPANKLDVNGSVAIGTYAGVNAAPTNGITMSGNLGVGTTNPNSNGGASTGIIHLNSAATQWSVFHSTNVDTGSAGGDGTVFGTIGVDAYVFNYEPGAIIFGTNTTERMSISSAGLVSMGTASITGASYLLNSKCSTGQVLTSDASTGLVSCVAASGLSGVISGSGTTNNLTKFTGTASVGNSIIYDSGSAVGIGTTTPGNYKLNVNGNTLINGNLDLPVSSTISSNGVGTFTLTNPADAGQILFNTGSTAGYISKINIAGRGTGTGIQFFTRSNEIMRVSDDGNVGIGTTTPAQKLHVNGPATGYGQGVPASSGTTQYGILRLTPGEAYAGETLDFGMNVATPSTYAWIQSTNTGNLAANYNLALNPNGGNVGIGTTAPSYLLDVNGQMRAERYRGINSLVLNSYLTANPASNVYLYSPGNDRDSWIYLDSADTGSNWGIYHRQIDSAVGDIPGNSIAFVGGGSSAANAYINLANGNSFFRGSMGIGTTAPGAALEVIGATSNQLRLFSSVGGYGYQIGRNGATGFLDFKGNQAGYTGYDFLSDDGAHLVTVIDNGFVGIGTTAPGTKLDVVGGSIRSDTQLISTVATGTAPLAVSSTTLVSNLNADYLDGTQLARIVPYHSGSDFVDGTLVTTDIPATASEGASFVIEISGKSYSSGNPPFLAIAQGYLYANTIISYSGLTYGGNFVSYIKMFENGGYLCFWWPRYSYWNSFNVNVRDAGGSFENRVTSVVNSAEPTGTKKVQVDLWKAWNSGNDGSGSGLDADLLDSHEASYFATASGTVTGTGTDNYIPRWNAAGTGIENSIITDTGSTVSVAGDLIATGATPSLYVWASDSGTSDLFLGEDTSGGYGMNLYWDSAYTYTMRSRYAGTDTAVYHVDTRDADLVMDQPINMNSQAISGASTITATTFSGALSGTASNADLFDSTDSAYFNMQRGTIGTTSDWDAAVTPGMYGVASGGGVAFTGNNAPTGVYVYGVLVVEEYDGYGIVQTYYPHTGSGASKVVRRTGWSNAGWQSWVTVWASNSDGSGSGLDADVLDSLDSLDFARVKGGKAGSYITPTEGLDSSVVHDGTFAAFDGYGVPVPGYGGSDYWVGAFTLGTNNRGLQIAGGYSDGQLYFRNGAGTWQGWKKIWTSSSDGSGTGLDADTVDGQQPIFSLSGAVLTSTAGDWNVASSTNGEMSYPYASIELRESNFGGSASYTAPRLAFHWGGVVASQIGVESSGTIVVLNNPGTSYEAFKASTITATTQFSGPGTGLTGTAASLTVGNSDTVDAYHETSFIRARGGIGNANVAVGSVAGWGNDPLGGTYSTSYVGHSGAVLMSNDVGGSASSLAIEATYYGDMIMHANVDSTSWTTYRMWTAGNDGATSGLDADLLDGQDSAYYAVAANYLPLAGGTMTGQLVTGTNGININRASTSGDIWFAAPGTDTNHVLWNDYYGGPTTRGAAGSGWDGMKWNAYNGLQIRTGSAGATDRLIIDGPNNYINLLNSNVGIGDATPDARLHVTVAAGSTLGTIPTGTSQIIESNTHSYLTMRQTADSGLNEGIVMQDNNIGGYMVFHNYDGGTMSDSMVYGAYQDHIFQTGSTDSVAGKTEIMRIDGSASAVGIGDSTPDYTLDVEGSLNAVGILRSGGNFIANGDNFYMIYPGSYYHSPQAVIRKDSSATTVADTPGDLVLYNANGGINTMSSLVFASREQAGTGNDVALAGINGWKVSAGTANGWSQGGLKFWVKDYATMNEAMTIIQNGYVGIGITPDVRFHIAGASYSTASAANSNVKFEGGGGNGLGFGTLDSSATYASWIQSGYVPNFGTATYNLLLNPLGGNVGIGTTAPSALLHISGTGTDDAFFRLTSTTTPTGSTGKGANINFYQSTTRQSWMGYLDYAATGGASTFNLQTYNGDIRFAAGAGAFDQYRLTIKGDTGNVGIGTTSPDSKLDVHGSVFFNADETMSDRFIDSFSRSVGSTAGDYVEIGSVATTGVGTYITIYETHHYCGTINSGVYQIQDTYYTGATTDWVQVPTVNYNSYSGGQDYAVDARRTTSGGAIELRFRSLGGACASGTAYFEIQTNGDFTPTTGSGSGATVPAGYLGKNAYQFPVSTDKFTATTNGLFIVNTGRVGIGNTAPTEELDVTGDVAISGCIKFASGGQICNA